MVGDHDHNTFPVRADPGHARGPITAGDDGLVGTGKSLRAVSCSWCFPFVLSAHDLEPDVDVAARRVRVGTDLLMCVPGERRKLRLREALVLDR